MAVAWQHTLPPSPSQDASLTNQFSADHAMQHVQRIGAHPHPTGSDENAAVRQYLIDEITRLGFKPQVQSAMVVNPQKQLVGRVQNVLVKVPGAKPGKAVLLLAHYDSVPTGPGAADDGASVAAILETLRAIKSRPALHNDVICLFTDSEENGLLGANAFVNQHSWAKDIGLVLNFEYRGNSGAFMMFETSAGNGKLIEGLAAAVPTIQANSLMYEVYNRLPNDTDFTVFKNAGFAGMNFAAIEGFAAYHTALDRPEAINQGTLQHEGDIMLALVKQFGNQSLGDLKAENRVYFDIPALGIVHYRASWSKYLSGFLAVMYIVFLWLCYQSKAIRCVPVLTGFIIFPAIITGFYFLNKYLCSFVLSTVFKDNALINYDNILSYGLYLGFIVLNIILVGISVSLIINKWLRHNEMAINILAIWLIGVLFLQDNGASFVMAWPLLGVLIAVVLAQLPTLNGRPLVMRSLMLLGCVPAVLILVPLLKNLFVALTAGAIPILMIPLDCALYLMVMAYYVTQQNSNLRNSVYAT